MLRNSIIKAMVYGFIVMLIASGITLGKLETKNQKVEQNIISENDSGYPFVGSILEYWNGRLLTRPHGTLGYPADRNYSFPVHNGVAQLSFTVKCYVGIENTLLPIPHISLFYAEIRDHNGVFQGKVFRFNTMKTKGYQNFSMILNSTSTGNVGDIDKFTVTLKGWGWPSILKIIFNPTEHSYPIWVTYTEEG